MSRADIFRRAFQLENELRKALATLRLAAKQVYDGTSVEVTIRIQAIETILNAGVAPPPTSSRQLDLYDEDKGYD